MGRACADMQHAVARLREGERLVVWIWPRLWSINRGGLLTFGQKRGHITPSRGFIRIRDELIDRPALICGPITGKSHNPFCAQCKREPAGAVIARNNGEVEAGLFY